MELCLQEIRLAPVELVLGSLSANKICQPRSQFGVSKETPAARVLGTSSRPTDVVAGSLAAALHFDSSSKFRVY
jgi:hypothetical protein